MSGYLQFYAKHPALSKIAEALNLAGSGFHNTSEWNSQEDYFDGKSACDLIQEAFDEADKVMSAPSEKLDAATHLATQRNLIALKCGAETAWIVDQAINALRSATPQLTTHELAHLFEVIEDSGIKLEDGVWDKLTDAMRDNSEVSKESK